jgi:hypothetical protein
VSERMQEQSVDHHLNEALLHLEIALNVSIRNAQSYPEAKRELAPKWENFLSRFFGMVKEKGKQSKINLLSWISFAKLR